MSSSKSHTLNPPMKWAQRKDCVYLTVDIQDTQDIAISINEGDLSVHCQDSNGNTYEVKLVLFNALNAEESKWRSTGRQIELNLVKKDVEEGHWPRLTKDKKKLKFLTLDWNKYVDSDEEQDDSYDWGEGNDMPQGGPQGMGGMGGGGGMGGMDMASMMSQMGGGGGGGGGGMGGGQKMPSPEEMQKLLAQMKQQQPKQGGGSSADTKDDEDEEKLEDLDKNVDDDIDNLD